MHPISPVTPAEALPLRGAVPRAGDGGDDGKGTDGGDNSGDQAGVATKTRAKSKKPSQYKVLMLTTTTPRWNSW